MDTCREIPDPRLRQSVGSHTPAVLVSRLVHRWVAGIACRWAGSCAVGAGKRNASSRQLDQLCSIGICPAESSRAGPRGHNMNWIPLAAWISLPIPKGWHQSPHVADVMVLWMGCLEGMKGSVRCRIHSDSGYLPASDGQERRSGASRGLCNVH
jgi:hypothetical protein